MADIERMKRALVAADAAGDVEAARTLATAIRSEMGTQPAPKGDSRGRTGGLTDVLGETFTLGLGHEAAGLARAMKPLFTGNFSRVPEAYSSGRNDSVTRARQAREAAPVTSFGLDMAAGMANPIARLLPGATQGGSMLANTARSAAGGAAGGAAYGFNTAQGDLSDRAEGALTGGLVGGAVGGLAPAAVEGASKGLRYLADQTIGRMGATNQATVAARKVAEALQRDGLDPQAAMARIRQLGPEAALLDVGPNSQALAAATARAPGQGKTTLESFVTARQEGTRGANNVLQGGQVGRIGQVLDDVTPQRFRQSVDALDAQRKTAAAPLYDEAYSANKAIDSPLLQRIESTPAGKRAFDQARVMMQNDMQRLGAPDAELTALAREAGIEGGGAIPKGGVAGGLKLEFWDYVKRALDDQIGAAQRGGANQEARTLVGLKSSLVRELDALDATAKAGPNSVKPEGGAYARARAAYAGPSQLIDATEQGAQFLRTAQAGTPDDVAKAVAAMSPDEKHAFRIGAVQALRDRLEALPTRADATKKLMDVPALEAKVRAAFGDDALFSRYIEALKGERAKFDSYAAIKGNSKTAERMAADADLNGDPGGMAQDMVSLATNPLNPMNYLRAGVRYLGDAKARLGTPEPVRAQLAQMLAGRNTAPLNHAMQSVQMNAADRARLTRALMGGGSVVGGYSAP
jgi:hypothetical protein